MTVGSSLVKPGEIVTDANVWLNFALRSHPSHAGARRVITDCLATGVAMVASAWWEAEADSALRGMVRGGLLDAAAANAAQLVLDAAPVFIVYEPSLRALARQIADATVRHNVYDATYAALAVARGCQMWTADRRFFNAVQNEARGAYPVLLVENYAGEYAPAPADGIT